MKLAEHVRCHHIRIFTGPDWLKILRLIFEIKHVQFLRLIIGLSKINRKVKKLKNFCVYTQQFIL